ncbi:nitrilase-related carbon-nitrogen hydrolase [Neptunicoccus sediminis]|uniref:nitrilase-related carbon-nitrogen hydrolase n=1 Tax=Neptunicoccus sediminis TaxID=1892596 RepID=UPI0008461DF4|nr:nitrilase-related carbon-nitrogen hydrolase [Neptunicoccus sediminis]
MRIGVWQDETPSGGVAAARQVIATALGQAQAEGVEILVFPECFLTGYFRDAQQVAPCAGAVTAEEIAALQNLCDDTGVAFVLGSYLPVQDATANVALVFRPQTGTPLTYHKRALYGDWEKSVFQAGRGPLLFDYKGKTFAVLICFDVEFPELVREAAQLGAEAVLVPTALMEPDHWVPDLMVPSRAIENNVMLAYANRIGVEGHLTFIGKSQLCDADTSHRVVHSETGVGLISAELQVNPAATDYLREINTQGLPKP